MRILLVESSLRDNGAIRVSLDRAARWRQAGADVELLVVSHADNTVRVPPPTSFPTHFGTHEPRSIPVETMGAAVKTLRLGRDVDMIVSGREIGPALMLSAAAARTYGVPFSVTVQNNIEEALENYVNPALRAPTIWALKQADVLVAVAEGLKPGLETIGVDGRRFSAVPNGVNFANVSMLAAQEPEWRAPPGPFIIGVGRFTPQKGFDLLIRAHAEALEAGPKHNLVILGHGPDHLSLLSLAAELGVSDSVFLPGHLSNPHALVRRAAAFVLSSRWEGYPLTLSEALCIGTPMIAANCVSGPSEILKDGQFGALVPADDGAALAEAIVAHLSDPGELTGRAERGKASAGERFDPQMAASRHLKILAEAMSEKSGARSVWRRPAGLALPAGAGGD